MRYDYFNFEDTFANANGAKKQKVVVGEMSKLIANDKQSVITALRDAGVNLSRNAKRKEVAKAIKKNIHNDKMKTHLSVMILSNAQFSGANGEKGGFFKKIGAKFGEWNKKRQEKKASGGDSEKDGFFKKLMDKRKANKEAKGKDGKKEGFFKRWFNKNKEGLADVGTSLVDGIDAKSGGGDLEKGSEYYANKDKDFGYKVVDDDEGSGMGKKIAIGIGVLAIIGVAVYFIRKGGKGKK